MFEKIFKNTATATLDHPGWRDLFSTGSKSASGEVVTKQTAINTSAVYACLNIRASAISKLPIRVYQNKNGNKTVLNNEIDYLLNVRPNPHMTPSHLKKLISYNVDLYGDCYIWIDVVRGVPKGLYVIDNSSCQLTDVNGRLWLAYSVNGQLYKIPYESVLHFTDSNFTNMSDGVYSGKSKIDVLRDVIGNYKSSTKLLGKYYADGSLANVMLHTATQLSPEAKKLIKAGWKATNGGVNNADVMILDGGLEPKNLSMNFTDAQFVELAKLNIEEIARVFQVPLHMLADLTKSSFSNIQQQSMDFYINTIMPLLVAWEEEINYKMFSKVQRQNGMYCKFDLRNAMRADDKSRSEYYKAMISLGVYNINEVRALEDMNSIGEAGDGYRVSLNYIDVSKADEYQLNRAKGGERNVQEEE